jgi:hypothetical protein
MLSAKGCHEKLVDRERMGVFIGYSLTDKQIKLYAPDMGYTIRISVVYVDKETIGGLVDLQHCIPSGQQGTPKNLIVEHDEGDLD